MNEDYLEHTVTLLFKIFVEFFTLSFCFHDNKAKKILVKQLKSSNPKKITRNFLKN